MPHIFYAEKIPESRTKRLAILYWTLFAANTIISIVYNGVLVYINFVVVSTNFDQDPLNGPFWFWMYTFSHYSVGAL